MQTDHSDQLAGGQMSQLKDYKHLGADLAVDLQGWTGLRLDLEH